MAGDSVRWAEEQLALSRSVPYPQIPDTAGYGTSCVASIPHHSPISPQTYVVKVKRESPSEVTFVQRTFEEFQELHNKLRLLFPSSLLPRYPQTWHQALQCPAGLLSVCAL